MNIKNVVAEKREKRPQTMCIRRKSIKVKPIDLIKDNDSPLLSGISLYPQKFQEKPNTEKFVAQKIPLQTLGHEFEKTNKIYNKTDNYRKIQSLGIGERMKFPRASVNYLCSNKNDLILQLETRPKSSQNKKFTQSNQIFKNKNDVLNYQNRPGSSKSSRVFKRKVEIQNDPLNVENQQFDGLIRVTTTNGSSRFKNSKYVTKNRINTSVNPLQRNEKLPQKIDPQFYRLFAQ